MRKLFILLIEYIDKKEQTQGTETSQYLEEKKVKNDSLSSGERTGRSLNLILLSVVGQLLIDQDNQMNKLEYLTKESDSLVIEN